MIETRPVRGALLCVAGLLLFACMDATTKYLAADYDVPLIVAARYIGNLALMVVLLAPTHGRHLVETRRTGLVLVRGLCLAAASLFAPRTASSLVFAAQNTPASQTMRPFRIDFGKDAIAALHRRIDATRGPDMPFDTARFDVSVAGLVLNFVPEPAQAIAEMARVVRRGGVVAAYVWDYAGKMQLMRHFWNAACALDPSARDLDEGRRFAICSPQPLHDAWCGAALRDVVVRAIDIDTDFRDFDDYWSPFLGGQGPAPAYARALPDAARNALRERLRAAMPTAIDGSIALVARAWAVRGTR